MRNQYRQLFWFIIGFSLIVLPAIAFGNSDLEDRPGHITELWTEKTMQIPIAYICDGQLVTRDGWEHVLAGYHIPELIITKVDWYIGELEYNQYMQEFVIEL